MLAIDGHTSLYGILGHPVAHSLSPLFQNAFLKDSGINGAYLAFDIEPENLKTSLDGLYALKALGCNITVPHKENVLSWVEADEDALLIGAVNTIKWSDQGWQATNTDWLGFSLVLQGLEVNLKTTSVLLFGAGGTSKAICHALFHMGAEHIVICNRNEERAKVLSETISQHYPNIKTTIISWQDSDLVQQHIQTCGLLINATSIGLHDNESFPFLLNGVGKALDVVYKPSGKTVFGEATKAGDYVFADGLPMLIAQGIAAFEYWHEEEIENGACLLPDLLQSLQWVEDKLGREALDLPGWRGLR